MTITEVASNLELFDIAMLKSVRRTEREELILKAPDFNFCFGPSATFVSRSETLHVLKSNSRRAPVGVFSVMDLEDAELHTAALGMGIDVLRVGFEGGVSWVPDGKVRRNVKLEERLVAMVRATDFEIASATR